MGNIWLAVGPDERNGDALDNDLYIIAACDGYRFAYRMIAVLIAGPEFPRHSGKLEFAPVRAFLCINLSLNAFPSEPRPGEHEAAADDRSDDRRQRTCNLDRTDSHKGSKKDSEKGRADKKSYTDKGILTVITIHNDSSEDL